MNNGQWIWTKEGAGKPNDYADFSDSFEYSGSGKVTADISAETDYVLYVNGKYAGSGQYGDLENFKVYDSLDITPFLNKGANTVFITAFAQNVGTSCYRAKGFGLWYEIRADKKILAASSSKTLSRKNPHYVSEDVPKITVQLGFAVKYDNSVKPDDATFSPSKVLDAKADMHPRPIKKLVHTPVERAVTYAMGNFEYKTAYQTAAQNMQNAYLSAKFPKELCADRSRPIFPSKEGVGFRSDAPMYVVIDLGKVMTGHISLDIDAPAGTKVDVGFGEHLEDLRVRTAPGARNFQMEYVCGEGRGSFISYMRRYGCRYICVFVHAKEFTLYDATMIETLYPLNDNAFSIQDRLLRQIYDVSARTLKICMHEHYEDTPWREQSLYTMDSRNQMLCGYDAFSESDFVRESLRLMLLCKSSDGFLSITSPSNNDLIIPMFNLVVFPSVLEYVDFSGDTEFFEQMYPHLVDILEKFAARTDKKNGLQPGFTAATHWNFYEWTPGLAGNLGSSSVKSYDCPLTLMYVLALRAFAALCEKTGRKKEAAAYSKTADSAAKAVRDNFFDEKRGVYASFISESGEKTVYSQFTNSLACLSDIGSARTDKIAEMLFTGEGDLTEISLSHSLYKYQVLLGYGKKYANGMLDEIGKIWGRMLFAGATSFWETAQGADDFDYAGSHSHAWSAVPIYIMHRLREMGMEF